MLAGQPVTYTIRLTNASGGAVTEACDLVITDTLPLGMLQTAPTLLAVTVNGAGIGGLSSAWAAPDFIITLPVTAAVPPGGVLLLTFLGQVDAEVTAGSTLTNRAVARWESLPGTVSGERSYGPITATATLTTPLPGGLGKVVAPITAAVGSQVVFTVTVPNPAVGGQISGVVITDVVDARLRVDAASAGAFVSGQVVTIAVGVIAPYSQQTLVITATVRDLVTVTAGTQIPNQAQFQLLGQPLRADCIWPGHGDSGGAAPGPEQAGAGRAAAGGRE